MRKRIVVLMSAGALSTAAVLADTRIEFKTAEGAPVAQTMLVGHGKVRIDRGPGATSILDPIAGVMIGVNHDKREFTRIGLADFDQLAKVRDAEIAGLRASIAATPPDERAVLEARLAALVGAGADVKVVDTKTTRRIAGLACRVFHTTVNGTVTNESCIADVAVVDLSATDRETLHAAMAFGAELVERLAKATMPQLAHQLGSFKPGEIALRSTDIAAGARNTTEFVRAVAGPLPADVFTVPSTYKEQKFGEGSYVTPVVPFAPRYDARRGRAAIR